MCEANVVWFDAYVFVHIFGKYSYVPNSVNYWKKKERYLASKKNYRKITFIINNLNCIRGKWTKTTTTTAATLNLNYNFSARFSFSVSLLPGIAAILQSHSCHGEKRMMEYPVSTQFEMHFYSVPFQKIFIETIDICTILLCTFSFLLIDGYRHFANLNVAILIVLSH